MKTKGVSIALLCLFGLLIAGCTGGASVAEAKKSQLVGTWHTEEFESGGDKLVIDLEYKDDGTFVMKAGDGELGMKMDGTYRIEGDKVIQKVTTFALDGELPEEAKGMEDMIIEGAKEDIGSEEREMTVEFMSDDKIKTTDPDGSTMELERVK